MTIREEIEQWISENKSKAFIANELKCKQETLNRYLDKMGITYIGNQGGKGFEKTKVSLSLEEYLATSKDIQTNKIRKKILQEGIKPHRCERCGLTEWLGQPIPLELHHIDGDRLNNELSNLQLLCPNCHALTDNYRGKNIVNKQRVETISDEDFVEALRSSPNIRQALLKLGLSAKGGNYKRANELIIKNQITHLL